MRYLGRLALLAVVAALVITEPAAGKEGRAVVVIGPTHTPMVEPFRPFSTTLEQLGQRPTVSPPNPPYVLVYPLMARGIPMRPGRWYPRQNVLCSGWRTGVEAGCLHTPQFRGLLGTGIATGLFLFHQRPTLLTRLVRRQTKMQADGNEATAIEMSLNQSPRPATPPTGCVPFTAQWDGPEHTSEPTSFRISAAGGIYAEGKVYPLTRAAADFVIGE